MKKVAIVGYAHPSKNRAPFFNLDYHIWGMNYLYYRIPRCDLWFEMHYDSFDEIQPENYKTWLSSNAHPVMMQEKLDGIGSSIKYPIETIMYHYGGYFNCTVDYMIAYAIWLNYQRIELYGIHCIGDYEYEKKGINYWLGVCKGKGIDFSLPEEADILKPNFYGYRKEKIIEGQKNGSRGNVKRH